MGTRPDTSSGRAAALFLGGGGGGGGGGLQSWGERGKKGKRGSGRKRKTKSKINSISF